MPSLQHSKWQHSHRLHPVPHAGDKARFPLGTWAAASLACSKHQREQPAKWRTACRLKASDLGNFPRDRDQRMYHGVGPDVRHGASTMFRRSPTSWMGEVSRENRPTSSTSGSRPKLTNAAARRNRGHARSPQPSKTKELDPQRSSSATHAATHGAHLRWLKLHLSLAHKYEHALQDAKWQVQPQTLASWPPSLFVARCAGLPAWSISTPGRPSSSSCWTPSRPSPTSWP